MIIAILMFDFMKACGYYCYLLYIFRDMILDMLNMKLKFSKSFLICWDILSSCNTVSGVIFTSMCLCVCACLSCLPVCLYAQNHCAALPT